MSELKKIYNEIEKVKESGKSDYEKMVRIHELERLAGAETWTMNRTYSLSAYELQDYAQTQWVEIYDRTDEETAKAFDYLLTKEVAEAAKWGLL